MEVLMYALVLIGAVLVSSVLDQFLRGVSLPLVQMALGIVLYFFVSFPTGATINYELFLVMFIAPLLFDESRNVNNRMLWENRNTILSLAIGLVIVSVLIIGFVLHFIVPSVPLAAAFALGAALGPTDAVAVASLSKTIRLSTRQKASLLGEALLNDASGIVSFQFAIAAAVTGAFSLADAGKTFIIEFAGGILFGLALGVIAFFLMRRIRRAGVESATFHVCFEIFLPFFIYLVATRIHVSGILAVVAAGLYLAYIPQRLNPETHSFMKFSSRLAMASESVWKLLSFVLNGIIFTNLGIVLCSTLAPTLDDNSQTIIWLITLVLIITGVIILVRYLWVLGCDLLSDNPVTGERMHLNAQSARDALVTTLCGPKGAVSLAIASTFPLTLANGNPFPQRELLLFLCCGVVIVTLLIANFIVPLIAPKKSRHEDDELDPDVEITILKNVIDGLKHAQTPENKLATGRVMRMYFRRLSSARKKTVTNKMLRYMRQEVFLRQRDYIKLAIETDEVDRRIGERYLKRVDHMLRLLSRKVPTFVTTKQTKPLAGTTSAMRKIQRNMESTNKKRENLIFRIDVELIAIDYLELVCKEGDEDRKLAALALLSEHRPLLAALRSQLRKIDRAQGIIVSSPDNLDGQHSQVVRSETGTLFLEEPDSDSDEPPYLLETQAEALRMELDEIQSMYEAGRISRKLAREMREEIYLLQMGLTD